MKNKTPILFASLLALTSFGLLAGIKNQDVKESKASEEISISSSSDSFTLLDDYYDSDESFVYTADMYFTSGQAGGIAFGSEENNHYYVLNMDRVENHVKLLYFASNGSGGYNATELKSDYFIGNDKITSSELSMVNPEVAAIESVNLKVILSVEDSHAYAEFYIEGIKRFGVDTTIDLNNLGTSYSYQGGYLGFNCFNANLTFKNIEIGKSDYSYFSEPYRNQYHLQPFSKWSNDPNALCYYNGYYHVFYQYHPFSQYWGTMYWGHARSKDLIHFEFLPICLFPDTEEMGLGSGNAYMWSGCAITYKYGMSADIDSYSWFPNGSGNGIVAIFTRDGGLQDQIIMSSDDEGLTWTKRLRIPQTLTGYTSKIDWRDPKVFPLVKNSDGDVSVWGMTLSSYSLNKGWFLKSLNLVDWSIAGSFSFPTPECIGVGILEDDNGVEHAYLTNKSRSYILGTISYDSGNIIFKDEDNVDISTYSLEEMPLKELDYGPDSYASQSFYISDSASEFYGKDIVLNWFSGDLNASYCTGPGEYANLRERWNGGFTIPVEYGIKETSDGYCLTQKPITVDNVNLDKTSVVEITNQELNSNSDNPLNDVHTHIFELSASITTNNNSPITFKVDVGDDEYMQFGWNETDGYYVDRTNLDDKGINTNVDWHTKYASHILGESDTKTFYVLSDNGGLEVFCEDYSIPFYFVTTASMYSTGASLKADDAYINNLELNEVSSIYRKNVAAGEGKLYVASNEITLDTKLCTSKFVTCWYTGNTDLIWEELENDGVVNVTTSNQGINIQAIQAGNASYKVSADNKEEVINITVSLAYFNSDFTFNKEDIVSGTWVMSNNLLIGEKSSGNAFILAEESGDDFTYTSQFDILSGVAASIVFRAASDMSSYLVINYDANEKIVKLWSTHGELARSGTIDIDLTDIVLTVKASGTEISATINGNNALNYTLSDNEPLSGRFGLNVYSGKAQFKSLSLIKENYEYSNGDLPVTLEVSQYIKAIYNVTLGNIKLEPGFYYQSASTVYIKEEYFALLDNGKYQFRVVGSSYEFNINVIVNRVDEFIIDDITCESGLNVNIYIGNHEISSLKINDVQIDSEKYYIKDYTLVISPTCFNEGENDVLINDSVSFKVTIVNNQESQNSKSKNNTGLVLGIVFGSIGGLALIGAGIAVPLIIIKRRKKVA